MYGNGLFYCGIAILLPIRFKPRHFSSVSHFVALSASYADFKRLEEFRIEVQFFVRNACDESRMYKIRYLRCDVVNDVICKFPILKFLFNGRCIFKDGIDEASQRGIFSVDFASFRFQPLVECFFVGDGFSI